jgi:hypothetical protein
MTESFERSLDDYEFRGSDPIHLGSKNVKDYDPTKPIAEGVKAMFSYYIDDETGAPKPIRTTEEGNESLVGDLDKNEKDKTMLAERREVRLEALATRIAGEMLGLINVRDERKQSVYPKMVNVDCGDLAIEQEDMPLHEDQKVYSDMRIQFQEDLAVRIAGKIEDSENNCAFTITGIEKSEDEEGKIALSLDWENLNKGVEPIKIFQSPIQRDIDMNDGCKRGHLASMELLNPGMHERAYNEFTRSSSTWKLRE